MLHGTLLPLACMAIYASKEEKNGNTSNRKHSSLVCTPDLLTFTAFLLSVATALHLPVRVENAVLIYLQN